MGAGKGDKRRPQSVPEEVMERRWRRAFGEEEWSRDLGKCQDPDPRPPYTGRCILDPGHGGNHTDGNTQWSGNA